MPTKTQSRLAGLTIYRDGPIPNPTIDGFGNIQVGAAAGTLVKQTQSGRPQRVHAVAFNPQTNKIEKLLIGSCGCSPHWTNVQSLLRIWVRCV